MKMANFWNGYRKSLTGKDDSAIVHASQGGADEASSVRASEHGEPG